MKKNLDLNPCLLYFRLISFLFRLSPYFGSNSNYYRSIQFHGDQNIPCRDQGVSVVIKHGS